MLMFPTAQVDSHRERHSRTKTQFDKIVFVFRAPVYAVAVIPSSIVALFSSCGSVPSPRASVPAPPVRAKPPEAPASVREFEETGFAAWYGAQLDGHRTASGEIFDDEKFTAAHRTLPFGTLVEVINLENQKRVEVR